MEALRSEAGASRRTVEAGSGRRGGTVSRRGLLSGAGLLAGLGAAARPVRAKTPTPAPFRSRNHWLVRHATMGLTAEEAALADSLGYDQYLEYHLAYENIDDSALEALLAGYPTLFLTPAELYVHEVDPIVDEFLETTILRSVYSKRQLFERTVEFWTDHFNIDIDDRYTPFDKPTDDREVIRKHALGKFPDLLKASAQSPAMMVYLNNNVSTKVAPNENYARELMELHSLDVDGGYSQKDVEEVARCLTGWSVHPKDFGPQMGTFLYKPDDHDDGPKKVLGYDIPAGGGFQDGLIVLDILVNHPSTAKFIARKLSKWFLGYNPPQGLVDAVAATYTATGGDIKDMIRTIFHSEAAAKMPVKYKRPYHLMVSALRACGAQITDTLALREHLIAAGQLPYYWPAPDGYPDSLAHWSGLGLPRWNFAAALLGGEIAGVSVDVKSLVDFKYTAKETADVIDRKLFAGEMPTDQKKLIEQYILPDPPTIARVREAVGLALTSPAFQWY